MPTPRRRRHGTHHFRSDRVASDRAAIGSCGDFRQFAGGTTDKTDTTDTIVKLKPGRRTPEVAGYRGGCVDAFLSTRQLRALRYVAIGGAIWMLGQFVNIAD